MTGLRCSGLGDWCFVVLVVFLCWSGSVSAAEVDNGDISLEGQYRVGIGDVLEVSVWNEPDVSTTVFVRLDGKISVPLLGDVEAKGYVPEVLAKLIKVGLTQYITDPSVTVTLKESKSRMYYMLGQIASPGEYAIYHPVSVLQALARAGGLAEWAKKEKIIIVRTVSGKEKNLCFNYEKFLDGEGGEENISIEPGDTIIIP